MTLDTKGIEERERLAKEVARTSEAIRKKHRALKTGRVEQEVQLRKQLKPIVEPLQQIVENTVGDDETIRKKPRKIGVKKQSIVESDDASSVYESPNVENKANNKRKWLSSESKSERMQLNTPSPIRASTPLKPRKLFEAPTNLSAENVFETTEAPLEENFTIQAVQENPTALYDHMGPFGREYIGEFFSGGKRSKIDNVYGIYFNDEGTFLGDKPFDIDGDDNIIVGETKYAGTPGLYELIFKRIPDDGVYTDEDKIKYKSILLATNAHRRGHNELNPILGNKGYKYKNIIAPLIGDTKKGKGVAPSAKKSACSNERIPQSMTVTDNAVDYVHWDDPNELVDRLRLLDASHKAGNNSLDNEFLSIIEELREAGLIIN